MRRVIAKDYSTATPALLTVLLPLGLETLCQPDQVRNGSVIAVLIGLAVVVALSGLLARIAKKCGAPND